MAGIFRALQMTAVLVSGGIALAATATAQDRLVRETEALSPQAEREALHVPEGFEVQLFASEPMINKPINLAVDDRGRVWVSSTVEYPYAATRDRWSDEQGTRVKDSRDAIKILEDTDGDGSADKVTDFADGLNIPTGVLPWHKPEHHDGCIAWSIPNIWYFADTTGDGKCDLREELFGPLGFEKDTHGMCSSFRLGPDGWVYATHGFNNTSHFEAKDGSTLDLHSGNVFRFQPDGSRIELWSAGQVNPFGLCFDGRGNLYSADCHSAPVYQLLRGAMYPSFGKPHDGLGFAPTMIEHTHGSTGICGIAWIDRNIWGDDWNDRVLIGNPVNSRVNFDHIEFHGSTPVAVEQPDFVVSDDPWFRPVDLCLADDGVLYIADFYNKIIGHYEVPLEHPGRDRERGRIWRVVKKAGVQAPRPPIVPFSIADPIAALADESPFTKRAAASLLQDQPDLEAMETLLKSLSTRPEEDTHLRYVLRMALREHLKQPRAFDREFSNADEIAEIALAVPNEEAATFLFSHVEGKSSEFRLRCLRHIARYRASETLDELVFSLRYRRAGTVKAFYLASEIVAIREGLEERGMFTPPKELLSWADFVARELLDQRGESGAPPWQSLPHPEFPKSANPWVQQKRNCGDGREVDFLSSLAKGEAKPEQRTGILHSREFDIDGPISFWLCGHRGHPDNPAHEKNYVRLVDARNGTELTRAYPPRSDVAANVRWDLAGHMGKLARLEVVDGDAGPSFAWLALSRLSVKGVSVASFDEAFQSSKALRGLADLLKVHAPADLRDQLRPFLPAAPAARPQKVSAKERARLDAVIAARSKGFDSSKADAEKGGALFALHCAACHQVGGEGGVIGPQLDGIGSRGPVRLAEDILDPNRNVDAHFYLTTLTRNDGTVIAGFLLAERGEVLVLVDAAGNEVRITKGEIKKRETTALSLMPAGIDGILKPEQFSDLLAWLLERRPSEDNQR